MKKSGSSRLALTSAGSLTGNGGLAIGSKGEATRGAGCWSLDNEEKRKHPYRFDKF